MKTLKKVIAIMFCFIFALSAFVVPASAATKEGPYGIKYTEKTWENKSTLTLQELISFLIYTLFYQPIEQLLFLINYTN